MYCDYCSIFSCTYFVNLHSFQRRTRTIFSHISYRIVLHPHVDCCCYMTASRKIATFRWWRYTFLFSFLLNVSLIITFVYSEGEDTDIQDVQPVSTTSAPFTSSSPSTIPTQEPLLNTAIACSDYGCGDYSAAENLTDNINVFFKHHDEGENDIFNDINWTAVFEVKERSPFQFLKAGVSCAYDSVRPMFDIM